MTFARKTLDKVYVPLKAKVKVVAEDKGEEERAMRERHRGGVEEYGVIW